MVLPAASPPSLPEAFQDLYRWRDKLDTNLIINVIGVVTRALPPERTRGTDYQSLLEIHDYMTWNPTASSVGLDIKFFNKDENQLPRASPGDIVLIRSIKAKTFAGKQICLSNWGTRTIVFRDEQDQNRERTTSDNSLGCIEYPGNNKPRISQEEQAYVRWLKAWSKQNTSFTTDVQTTASSDISTLQSSARPTARRGPKFSLLQDVREGQFCDVVVHIIKIHDSGLAREIYVTDYTKNPWFYLYPEPGEENSPTAAHYDGDPHGYIQGAKSAKQNWPGPYDKYIFSIALFPPHASVSISEGDYVSIRNLRIAMDRDATHLEGKLHEDRRYPNKIDVYKISKLVQDHNKDLGGKVERAKFRRDEYWKEFHERVPVLASASDEPGLSSKAAKGKNKKRKKAAAEAEAKRAEEMLSNKRRLTNSSVRCGGESDRAVTNIAEIIGFDRKFKHNNLDINLPFVNRSFKAHVRVVDFYPPNLEDFCQWVEPRVPSSHPDATPDVTMLDGHPDSLGELLRGRWEWRFCLLVEDATVPLGSDHQDRLKLLVGPDNGDYLLKLAAKNLRENKKALQMLRELLFILWGNLEELKQQENYDPAVSELTNKPFHCCIQEYGVPAPPVEEGLRAWTRCHRIHLTTINRDD